MSYTYTYIGANVHDRHTTYGRRRTHYSNWILNCIYLQRAHQSLHKNSYLQVHKMFSSLQHQYDYVYKYSNPTYNKVPFLPIALDMGHSKFSQFNIFCWMHLFEHKNNRLLYLFLLRCAIFNKQVHIVQKMCIASATRIQWWIFCASVVIF